MELAWHAAGHPAVPAQVARFFDRLELAEPGIVSCSRWQPGALPGGPPAEVDAFCGVARKLRWP